MESWVSLAVEQLWRGALGVLPLAILVMVAGRLLPLRPSTRHSLCLLVLIWLGVSPLLPSSPITQWLDQGNGVLAQDDSSGGISSDKTTSEMPVVSTSDPAHEPLPATMLAFGSDADDLPIPDPIGRPAKTNAVDESKNPMRVIAEPRDTPNTDLLRAEPSPSRPFRLTIDHTQPASRGNVTRTEPRLPDGLAPASGSVGRLSLARPPLDRPRTSRSQPSQRRQPSRVHSRKSGASDVLAGASNAKTLQAITDLMGMGGFGLAPNLRPLAPVAVDPPVVPAEAASASHVLPNEPVFVVASIEPEGLKDAATPIATGPSWGERLMASMRPWTAGVLGVRDAIIGLPPFPRSAWLLGIGLLVGRQLILIARYRHRLGWLTPANDDACKLVADAARVMGLRRKPGVYFSSDTTSPVIWYSPLASEARLVLPIGLWSQLDGDARRAVVYHELAHLHRRDHWVRWIETAVGVCYWWHPVVWWVRKRLHEEAEICCDAWVTWLMPTGRRSYAEALLLAKRFTTNGHPPVPALGMAVERGRAKRFARRLTMVMTGSTKPGNSRWGMALAVMLAVAGWFATPVLSCPDEKKCETKSKTKAETASAVVAAVTAPSHVAPAAPSAHEAPTAAIAASAPSPLTAPSADTYNRHLSYSSARLAGGNGEDDLEDRIRRLEQAVEHLVRALEEKGGSGRGEGRDRERAEREERSARERVDRREERRPEPRGGFVVPREPREPRAPQARSFTIGGGGDMVRFYELSEGKLEALSELMVRSDVPVLVSPKDNGIEVHGDGHVQARFEAFVHLISPGEKEYRPYHLPEGKLEALTALMVRNDVPVMVSPSGDVLRVQGSELEQQIFRDFVEMINPDGGPGVGWVVPSPDEAPAWRVPGGRGVGADQHSSVRWWNGEESPKEMAARMREYGQVARVRAAELRGQMKSAAQSVRVGEKEARARLEQLQSQMEMLREQLEHTRSQSEAIREQADRIRERAESMREKAESVEHGAKENIRRDVDMMGQEAEAMERQAIVFEQGAEEVEQLILEMEQESEALETHADILEERSDALEEALAAIEDTSEFDSAMLAYSAAQFMESDLAYVDEDRDDDADDADGWDGEDHGDHDHAFMHGAHHDHGDDDHVDHADHDDDHDRDDGHDHDHDDDDHDHDDDDDHDEVL